MLTEKFQQQVLRHCCNLQLSRQVSLFQDGGKSLRYLQNLYIIEVEDSIYPNSTIGNDTPGGSDAGTGDVGTDEGQGSNTGIVIGVVVGLLGTIAIASIAAQYWISKNKTKVKPANIQTVTPREPPIEKEETAEDNEVEKEETTEQNNIEDNNQLDLVEEDLTGT